MKNLFYFILSSLLLLTSCSKEKEVTIFISKLGMQNHKHGRLKCEVKFPDFSSILN